MERADVTAIIPYYRDDETVERAVKSIINQTQQVSEIIIIDDYSNRKIDKQILTNIENKYQLVKIVWQQINEGPGVARNKGMDVARSSYFAFLDSDDIWTKDKIKKQYKIMRETNAFISGHMSAIYNHKIKETFKLKEIKPLDQFIKNRFATRSVMIKSSKNYRFYKNKRYAEDFLMWTQIILNKEKAIFIDEVLANSFKEDFGDSGLTSNMNEMFRGAVDAYRILHSDKKISKVTFYLLTVYQTFKYLKRIIKLKSKKR
ncbi:glycosyltransferase family 2 protein [Staphylococcus xylosus]|uniref:glycosyltransferase family 2 protein n=1 Tax=Staphylococcus xylosus TaxID=1288 RepID=UPI001CDBFC7F|nr:glycosyltransferase family 2 protein [Staphylococcus xylosus]UBV40155.1 glycosyltransferase family 2 protein [Staphylococcus xylosus]